MNRASTFHGIACCPIAIAANRDEPAFIGRVQKTLPYPALNVRRHYYCQAFAKH